MTRDSYRQSLPDLDLSIERYTDSVPADGAWYLLNGGKQLGRYRTLQAAKEGWDAFIEKSGWTPPQRPIDAKAMLQRESGERWARNRAG